MRASLETVSAKVVVRLAGAQDAKCGWNFPWHVLNLGIGKTCHRNSGRYFHSLPAFDWSRRHTLQADPRLEQAEGFGNCKTNPDAGAQALLYRIRTPQHSTRPPLTLARRCQYSCTNSSTNFLSETDQTSSAMAAISSGVTSSSSSSDAAD